jgi:hypothetical protein
MVERGSSVHRGRPRRRSALLPLDVCVCVFIWIACECMSCVIGMVPAGSDRGAEAWQPASSIDEGLRAIRSHHSEAVWRHGHTSVVFPNNGSGNPGRDMRDNQRHRPQGAHFAQLNSVSAEAAMRKVLQRFPRNEAVLASVRGCISNVTGAPPALDRVYVTQDNTGGGGVGNLILKINAGLSFALSNGLEYLLPPLLPFGHDEQEEYVWARRVFFFSFLLSHQNKLSAVPCHGTASVVCPAMSIVAWRDLS